MIIVLWAVFLGLPVTGTDVLTHLFLVHNWNFATLYSLNGTYWTLAIEAQFCLLLPLFGNVVLRLGRGSRRWLIAFGLLLFSASPLCGVILEAITRVAPKLQDYGSVLYVFGFLTVFGTGGLCSIVFVAVTESRYKTAQRRPLFRWVGVGGVAVLGLYLFIRSRGIEVGTPFSVWYWLVGNILLALGFGGLLLGVVLGWRTWERILNMRVLRFVGGIAYSLAIWNQILYLLVIFPVTNHFVSGTAAMIVALVLTLVLMIPFSLAFYHLFERPFIRLRQSTRKKAVSAPLS